MKVVLLAGGFGSAFDGMAAAFSYAPCWILLAVTAGIGMYSFLCWYTAIDNIGAAKALCLNVTYAFWGGFFVYPIKIFAPVFLWSSVMVYRDRSAINTWWCYNGYII